MFSRTISLENTVSYSIPKVEIKKYLMKLTRGKRRRIWGTWKSWGRTEIGVFPICKPRRQNPSPGKSANENVNK